MLWATSASSDYPVYIGDGLVTEHGFWPSTVTGRRLLVTDYHAGRLYGERFEPFLGDVRIMPGEQSKTIAHAEIVWTEMVRHGATRSDVVVALGGGVVGDLAGFCAATYQRGMRVVQVPTTLVAQVDSAIGGKTGVDLAEAKNYVGAFHQPSAVIADPATLETLPAEELAAGYAEVLKTGLISGGALWDRLQAGASPADLEVIAACAQVKVRIVSQDERDEGLRQILNLGHTVAHAIETATGYARYRHGEAVGLGLLAELRLSGADELRAQVREMLVAAGLPARARGHGRRRRDLRHRTRQEAHRRRTGPVRAVLPARPGDAGLHRRARRPAGRGAGADRAVSATRNRVEVMHGVNLDQLGRRDPTHYGGVTFAAARAADRHGGARAGSRGAVLPDQPRGRVRRAPARARGRRRRDRAESRARGRTTRTRSAMRSS